MDTSNRKITIKVEAPDKPEKGSNQNQFSGNKKHSANAFGWLQEFLQKIDDFVYRIFPRKYTLLFVFLIGVLCGLLLDFSLILQVIFVLVLLTVLVLLLQSYEGNNDFLNSLKRILNDLVSKFR